VTEFGDAPAPLPLENGKPRVQRLVERIAPVHLELEPPVRDPWMLEIGGLVGEGLELSLDRLREFGAGPVQSDFHCVWGWSRPKVNWVGVQASKVFDAADVSGEATHVRFAAADSPYASCVPLDQARDGWFALELEGEPLPAIHGGPLRWLQPPYLWGYKGVKWVCSATVLDRMDAGPWETKVGDVDGAVPQGLIDRFHLLEES
jgi:DMSO/TMAO reductase YedYZ molybdopterin-dependent catalytic subunit